MVITTRGASIGPGTRPRLKGGEGNELEGALAAGLRGYTYVRSGLGKASASRKIVLGGSGHDGRYEAY